MVEKKSRERKKKKREGDITGPGKCLGRSPLPFEPLILGCSGQEKKEEEAEKGKGKRQRNTIESSAFRSTPPPRPP